MIVENLQTLKIHKLTEAQYQRTLSEGNIDPNALYLTPDESLIIDDTLSISGAAADAKAVGNALAEKQPKGNYLNHSELSGAINTALTQAKESGEFDGKDGYTPYVTPQMFGAVADGATDDTVAVQTALDIGGEIFFPSGVYKCTSQLTTTKPCTIRMEQVYPSANAEENDSMFSDYTARKDYPTQNDELGYGARIETYAIDGCGLLVTDGSSVDGLSIRAMDGFSGILFKYDGSKGFRSYPSTTRLRHIKVDCDTSTVVPEAMFDFQPHGTHGTVVEDVVIGSNHTRQFARYGFRSSLAYWANDIRLKDILVDVVAEQPFYINANGKQAKNWTISNVAIQSFPCKSNWLIPSHVNIAYLKGLSDLYISGCKLWDVDTTEGADNPTTVSGDVLYNGVISATAFGNDSWFDSLDTILTAKLSAANELNLAKLTVTVETSTETGSHTVLLSDGNVTKSFLIPATSLSDEQVAAAITEWMEENADPKPVVGKNKLNPEECYDGSLSNSGTEITSTSYWTTGYIACGVGDVIRFIGLDGNIKSLSYLFLFDEKKNFIQKVTDPSGAYTIATDGTAYIRYLIPKTGTYGISYDSRVNCMLTVNDSSTTYEPYTVTMEGGIAQYIDLDAIAAKIDLTDCLKKEEAVQLYQPKGNYLTSYTETDPTVPDWAKQSTKPSYTASEVGADSSGTASSLVASHNTSTDSHSDIREILNNKLDSSELSSVIDTALAEAKESGEFDGDDYVLTDVDKEEIASLVPNVTTPEAPAFANGEEEITDTSKVYVNTKTGTLWRYQEVVESKDIIVTDKITATTDNPYLDGNRLGSSGDGFSSDASGYHITPLIDLTPYAGKTIQLHLNGCQYASTGTYATWIQSRTYGTDKAVLATRPYTVDVATDTNYLMGGATGISVTYNSETSATLTIEALPLYGSDKIPVGYIRFCGKGAIANSDIYITYIDGEEITKTFKWVDTGTIYGPAITEEEKQQIADDIIARIDTELLSVVGSGEVV